MKRKGSGSKHSNVHFNRCEPVHWWEYPIRYESDWKPTGPAVSHHAKNEMKAKALKEFAEYSSQNKIQRDAAALSGTAQLTSGR